MLLAEQLYGRPPPSPYSREAASGHSSCSSLMASETAERGESSVSAGSNRRSAFAARFLTWRIPFSERWSSFLLVPFGHVR